jgi:hypothetical protein
MMETIILEEPSARRRFLTAPCLVEREQFLTHLLRRGFGPAYLRTVSFFLLRIIEFLAKFALSARTIPADVAAKVKNYLFSIFEGFPDSLFQDEPVANLDENNVTTAERPASPSVVMRSSTSDFETLPLSRMSKQNLANDLAAMGLLLARKNKDRHPSIQDFMLANDSCTIACEVPVYLTSEEVTYYKSKGFFLPLPELSKPITGHIDIV